MIVLAKNQSENITYIEDLGSFEIPGLGEMDLAKYFPLHSLADSSSLATLIGDGTLIINNGEQDLSPADALSHVTTHSVMVGPKDRSGKLRVHQTSRKLGLRICWAGVGDDPTDVDKVGGGEPITMYHKTGDAEPMTKYIDLNCVNNETWLHEGYLTWNGGQLDTLTLDMVPRTVSVVAGSNTFYNLYGGYMVIPAAGDGVIDLASDITDPNGGLVYMPDDDEGNPPTAFWNATYNPVTKLYENISAAPYGDGRYNMFTVEVTFARFVSDIPLLQNGFIALNSSDTDQLGHGMRLRMTGDTNINGDFPDHDWQVACILCMHRKRSI